MAVGVTVGVAVAVGVVVGVRVLVSVAVGADISVGRSATDVAGIEVGADTGAQAERMRVASKTKANVRFILLLVLLRRSLPPNGLRFTCAAKRSGAASGASACWAASFRGFKFTTNGANLISCHLERFTHA